MHFYIALYIHIYGGWSPAHPRHQLVRPLEHWGLKDLDGLYVYIKSQAHQIILNPS